MDTSEPQELVEITGREEHRKQIGPWGMHSFKGMKMEQEQVKEEKE